MDVRFPVRFTWDFFSLLPRPNIVTEKKIISGAQDKLREGLSKKQELQRRSNVAF